MAKPLPLPAPERLPVVRSRPTRARWLLVAALAATALLLVLASVYGPGRQPGGQAASLVLKLLASGCSLGAAFAWFNFLVVTGETFNLVNLLAPAEIPFAAIARLSVPDGRTLVLALENGQARRVDLAWHANGRACAQALVKALGAAGLGQRVDASASAAFGRPPRRRGLPAATGGTRRAARHSR